MVTRNALAGVIGFGAALAIAAAFFVDPIAQDPAYHEFSDRHRYFGIPNFWNIVTNLPFLMAGIVGLVRLPQLADGALRMHYLLLCIGVALVGFGSAYYHYDPSTPALVWDRLPMTIAFMALFAAVLSDRVSATAGRALLLPLIVLGISSIAWWIHTEFAGRGDLRPYVLVQFLPVLLIPAMLLLSRHGSLSSRWLWTSLGAYVAAKLAEHLDPAILDATGVFSGHSLKHLFAALGAWCAIRAFQDQKSPARAL